MNLDGDLRAWATEKRRAVDAHSHALPQLTLHPSERRLKAHLGLVAAVLVMTVVAVGGLVVSRRNGGAASGTSVGTELACNSLHFDSKLVATSAPIITPTSESSGAEGALYAFVHGSNPDAATTGIKDQERWHAVHNATNQVDYLSVKSNDGIQYLVQVARQNNSWSQTQSMGCRVVRYLSSVVATTWSLYSNKEKSATDVVVIPRRDQCYQADQVPVFRLDLTEQTVSVLATFKPPEPDTNYVCEVATPVIAYRLPLGEPLGDRELLDGATYPNSTPEAISRSTSIEIRDGVIEH